MTAAEFMEYGDEPEHPLGPDPDWYDGPEFDPEPPPGWEP